jgi:hypothetical protein
MPEVAKRAEYSRRAGWVNPGLAGWFLSGFVLIRRDTAGAPVGLALSAASPETLQCDDGPLDSAEGAG